MIKKLLSFSVLAVFALAACRPQEKPGTVPTPQPDEPQKPEVATISFSDVTASSDAVKYDSSSDKLTVNFTDAEGSVSFKLKTSDSWTIKATNDRADSWISVSPSSGSKGEATVKFSAKTNDTYDGRSADFEITCGSVKKSVRVVQKQKDAILISDNKAEISDEGGELKIELQYNIDYSVEISEGVDWIKRIETKGLNKTVLSFEVEPNDGTKSREGSITVSSSAGSETVTVCQAGALPYIVIGQKVYNVDSDANQIEILVTSNTAVSLSIEGSDWLQHDQTKAASTDKYVFNVRKNTSYDSRTGRIVFYTDNGLQEDVVVNQSALGALIIAGDSYDVPSEGGDYSFELSTNMSYTVSTDTPWIHIIETKGLSRHDVRFSVEENAGVSARTGSIVVRSGGKSQEVLIKQSGLVPHLVISQTEYNVDSGDHQIEVYVTRNTPVSYRIEGSDWIEIVQTKAVTTDRYVFSISENTSYDPRTGRIVFYTDNGLQEEVIVTQMQKDALVVAEDSYQIPRIGGGIKIEVGHNVEYNVSIDQQWVANWGVMSTKAYTTDVILFYVYAMSDGEANREATITFTSSDGSKKQEVLVKQGDVRSGLQKLENYTTLSRDRITAVNFITGSDKTTSMMTDEGGYPIYGETVGTTVNIYTRGDKFLVNLSPYVLSVPYSAPEEVKGYFEGCTSLRSLDLRSWDTSISDNMSRTFLNCNSLQTVDVSSFDTRNVIEMQYMFSDCQSLTNIDLSSFETPNLISMDNMFANHNLRLEPKLERLDLSNFDTSNLNSTYCMLHLLTNLRELNLKGWKSKFDLVDFMLVGTGRNVAGGMNVYCDQDLAEHLIRKASSEPSINWIVPGGFRLYESSDYSMDGKVSILNKATVGNGVNVFIFGDGFADKDIADGTYEDIARQAMEGIFAVEPFKSLRDMFNVYMVDNVSKNNLFLEGAVTAFSSNPSSTQSGSLSFDSGKIKEEVRKIVGESAVDRSTAILLVHHYSNAGAAYLGHGSEPDLTNDYASGFGVGGTCLSYLESTLRHEFGHAFAKLDEEYVIYNGGRISEDQINVIKAEQNDFGWWTNVDFTDNLSFIRWADYVSDSRYASENIGAYEGAGTYETGVWRPTENSFMNMNWGGYNAPSRETIYRRIHKLAYGASWEFDRETFKQWDTQKTKSGVRTTTKQVDNQRTVRRVEKDYHIISR